jgi:hypothetical protein
MTVEVEIKENGKVIKGYVLNPKDYKSGKKGFYASVQLVLSGKIHRGNIMFYATE